MEEKIKIYVPETVNNILLKDIERFEFFKNDGSFNKNEFYNTLILNYYEQYQENQSSFYDHIKKAISDNFSTSDLAISDVTSKILDYIDLKTNRLDDTKSEIALAIKPTKKTSDIFNFIQNYSLGNSTLSSYFRNMFASYSLLPQDKREQIIFKHNFELLEKAIKEDRKIYFTTASNNTPHICSPYSLCNSKEELFNYVLVDYKNLPYSFRVGRIKNLKVLNETRVFSEINIDIFKKMELYGPQYSYKVNEPNTPIKVAFTETGKAMLKSIYIHRPKYTKGDDGFYYFECSLQQAYQYFNRFGKHAIVIEPIELVKELQVYYAMGNKAYWKVKK